MAGLTEHGISGSGTNKIKAARAATNTSTPRAIRSRAPSRASGDPSAFLRLDFAFFAPAPLLVVACGLLFDLELRADFVDLDLSGVNAAETAFDFSLIQ